MHIRQNYSATKEISPISIRGECDGDAYRLEAFACSPIIQLSHMARSLQPNALLIEERSIHYAIREKEIEIVTEIHGALRQGSGHRKAC